MMIKKEELSAVLGLSCVENYVLAWLLNQRVDINKLYATSYVPMKEIFEDFSNGAVYERYQRIPRLQDVAENCGIITHNFLKPDRDVLYDTIKKRTPQALCVLRVNEKFFSGSKRRPWRDDHYICVDENLCWINDYPLLEGGLSSEEVKEVYGGSICIFRMRDNCCIVPNNAGSICKMEAIDTLMPLNQLQGAVGVLRITRRRLMHAYEDNERVSSLLSKECELLDLTYFNLNFYLCSVEHFNDDRLVSIRNRIFTWLEKIVLLEKEWTEYLYA